MKRLLQKAYREFKQQHPSATVNFDNFSRMAWTYGTLEIEKMSLKDFEQKLDELEAKNLHPHVALVPPQRLEPQMSIMDPKPSSKAEKKPVKINA